MQGAERREVVQATPATGVADRAAMPGVQMRYAKTPMAAEETGRGAATLAMLAEKAMPAVQALHAQTMKEDFLKGQMQFSQGKAYADIKASGASYATVSGAAALHAQKLMQDTYIEGLKQIDAEDHKLTPEQYTAKVGEISKGLFTGDELVDNFMTEIAAPQVMKLAEAQAKAHEAWKVQETMSAKRDLLLSTSKSTDADSDMQLDALIKEPMGLNPEDHKSVMLEAALLGMKQGDARIYEKLGGIDGIRAQFSTTAAEESSILAGVSELANKKEQEWNADMNEEHLMNYNALSTGKITHAQAIENGQKIADKYGKGNATMKSFASDYWGAEMKRQTRMEAEWNRQRAAHERMLEKGAAEYQKQLELYTTAGNAVSRQQLYSLDKKEKAAAFELVKREIDAGLVNDVKEGRIDPLSVSKEASKRMARAVDKFGVVNDGLADHATALLNSNLVTDEKGQVYENVLMAYRDLSYLYETNPALAMSHLKTDAAKHMFIMARDMELDTDLDAANALRQAATNMRAEVTPKFADSFFGKSFDTTMQEVAKDKIVDMAPSLKPFTGTQRGSTMEVSTWELERAASNPMFLKQVTRLAKSQWMKSKGALDTEQAAKVAMQSIQRKAAYVVGNIIAPETDDSLHKIMGVPEYSNETGVPHEAVVEFVKERGPKYWGKQWFDTEIATRGDGAFMGYIGTQMQSMYRDAPEMNISLEQSAQGYVMVMHPVLNDGTDGKALVVPAREIGEFYRNWRNSQTASAPKFDMTGILNKIPQ